MMGMAMNFDNPADVKAHFDIGTEDEICMCSCHRVKHGTVECLTPGCGCNGFVSKRAARIFMDLARVAAREVPDESLRKTMEAL